MEGTIGEIRLFGGTFAPQNWAYCDGQLIAIGSNPALFSVLGTQYGGDGKTTFALPKMAAMHESDGGPTPIRFLICVQGAYPKRP